MAEKKAGQLGANENGRSDFLDMESVRKVVEEHMRVGDLKVKIEFGDPYEDIPDSIKIFFYNDGEAVKDDKKTNFVYLTFRDLERPAIIKRILSDQGEGLGLALECSLIKIGRKLGVKEYTNVAETNKERGDIGAYVWASYDYKFRDNSAQEIVQGNFLKFCKSQGIVMLYLDDRELGHPTEDVIKKNLREPIDFARVEGMLEGAEERIPAGKNFLLNTDINWAGRRPLGKGELDNFVRLLKKKGKDDLIEETFDPKEAEAALK